MSRCQGTVRFRLVDLPLRRDPRGSLGFAQLNEHIPFAVKRVFYLYDLPAGTARAGHAHRAQHQFLVMLAGSCRASLDDGTSRAILKLDSPQTALYVPPMYWLDLDDFTAAAICLVLTSDLYDPADYVRDPAEFRHLATGEGPPTA